MLDKAIKSKILLKCLYCESPLIYNIATLIEDLNEVKFVLTNSLKVRIITFNTFSANVFLLCATPWCPLKLACPLTLIISLQPEKQCCPPSCSTPGCIAFVIGSGSFPKKFPGSSSLLEKKFPLLPETHWGA